MLESHRKQKAVIVWYKRMNGKKKRLRWDPKTIRRVSICHGNIMEYDHVDITNDMGFGWIWDYLYIYIYR
jgi:hypothetical protein